MKTVAKIFATALGALFILNAGSGALRAADAPAADAAPAATAPAVPETLHPALFLVGDSITSTGKPPGDFGAYGMGWEIIPLFDATKIHVYNVGAGGRSSRSYYYEQGQWDRVLTRMQPGDYVIMMFGHNDAANSDNYPTRTTITGSGDETIQIGFHDTLQTVHTYGWYLRQYVNDAKAKGVTVIICSPVPREQWNGDKIKRGFDGYAQWAADAAKASGAPFIDLNTISANKYDALGVDAVRAYFADTQHPTKAGAKLNAQSVVEGLKLLKDVPLAQYLLPDASAAPAK